MFCPNCGMPNTDTSTFCAKCGKPLAVDNPAQPAVSQPTVPQPVQSVPQPVQPNQSGQSSYTQPQQPSFAQPQQPQQPTYNQQPAYMGGYSQQVAVKKSKTGLIIGVICGVAVVAFLIVLFTVIIPNSGDSGKLRHVWEDTYGYETLDLKNNTVSSYGISMPLSWSVSGDKLKIDVTVLGVTSSQEFTYSLSDDGMTLKLTSDGTTSVYKRTD